MDDLAKLVARIDDLETAIAHQDRAVADLDETVVEQWKRIDELTRRVALLSDQLRETESRLVDGGREPPPPHY